MTDEQLIAAQFPPPFAALQAPKFFITVAGARGRRAGACMLSLEGAREYANARRNVQPRIWRKPAHTRGAWEQV